MIFGYLMACFGLGGIIYVAIMSSFDSRVDYGPLWAFFIAVFVIGIIITVIGTVVKKKKEKLIAAQNIVGTDSVGNPIYRGQCPVCKLNVADNCFTCPQCGQRIR